MRYPDVKILLVSAFPGSGTEYYSGRWFDKHEIKTSLHRSLSPLIRDKPF